jgi:predicted enzyme related to lactoylglutathione lyase
MEADKTKGAVTWMDLTVPDADSIRDFYADVVGWKIMDVSMGDYNDYCMMSPDDNVVRSGICHARGGNQGVPPSWIIYINVTDLDTCMDKVKKAGGEIVHGPKKMGDKARYCIMKDPAGAYCGLYDHG